MTEGRWVISCHSRLIPLLSFPPGLLLSFPLGLLLSFPQVVSGNPVSFSSVSSFVWPYLGRNPGFPIKNVGNDREGDVGNDRREGVS